MVKSQLFTKCYTEPRTFGQILWNGLGNRKDHWKDLGVNGKIGNREGRCELDASGS
jgi:hypothetical protein